MAWTPAIHTTFTGPVSAVGAGSQLQNGWVDVAGGLWSIDSNGNLRCVRTDTPRNNGLLSFPPSSGALNQRADITFTASDPSKFAVFAALRSTASGATSTQYVIGASYNSLGYWRATNGTTYDNSSSGYSRRFIAGETLTLSVQCIQGASSTTITGSLTDSAGAVLATLNIVDATAAMQSQRGVIALYVNQSGDPAGTLQVGGPIQSIATYSYTPAQLYIPVSSAAFRFSPANWVGDQGRGGDAWRRTWNCGASFEFSMQASSAPLLAFGIGSYQCGSKLNIYVNGVETPSVVASGVVSVSGLTPSATNTIRVDVVSTPQKQRWNNGVNAVKMLGAWIDEASSAGAAATLPKWGLIVGSSSIEGSLANNGVDYWAYNFTALMRDALAAKGYEIGVSAASWSDYTVPGDSDGSIYPYYLVTNGTYNHDLSRWHLCDQGVSCLDGNGQISARGDVGTAPDFVLIDYFANAAGTNANIADLTSAMTGCILALRKAAPTAWIFVMIPWPLYASGVYPTGYLQALQATIAQYQAEHPEDGRFAVIDIGNTLANRLENAVGTYINGDRKHLLGPGYALVAPAVLAQMQDHLAIPSYAYY
ncbi:SGNH/GDSL hydrolase family protein [Asaia siamensis]